MVNGQTIRTSECKSTKWVTLHVNMLRWVNLAKGAVKVAERCLPNQGPFVSIDGVVDIEGHLGKGGVRLGDEVRVESLAVVTTDTLVHGAVHDLVREGLHLVWGQPEGEFTIHCSFSELAFAGSVNLNYLRTMRRLSRKTVQCSK